MVRNRLPQTVEIVIVEQTDELKFNRGCLLNVGFRYCSGNRVIFHDVDLIPDDCLLSQYCHPWPAPVVHFGARFSRYNNTKTYFGGVTGFHRSVFPGFPNQFWGWGGEDDVLFKRTIARIHRPVVGRYTDLEFLQSAKQKCKLLRQKNKCQNRWELKTSDNPALDNHCFIPDSVRFSHRISSCVANTKTVQIFFY